MSFEVMAYHLAGNHAGLSSIKDNKNCLDGIIPGLLEAKENGELVEKSARDEIERLIGLMGRDLIYPLVQNYGLCSEVSNKLINNQAAISRLHENIVSFLEKYGFLGFNLNLEGIKHTNKKEFNNLIEILAQNISQKGYQLDISIPAKTENNKDHTWSGAYQYDILGMFVDRVMIMAYDYHWPGGPPGPIAPLSWVRDVIDYAIMEMPLEKICLGIGFYGYDWEVNSDKKARGLLYSQIEKIRKEKNLEIEWDQEAQSPYLKYKEGPGEHEIWFENSQSIKKKLQLVREFQLKGIVFWRPGQEDPKVWPLVKRFKQSCQGQ